MPPHRANEETRSAHIRGFVRSFALSGKRERLLDILEKRGDRRRKFAARWRSVLAGLEHWVDPDAASKDPEVLAALREWDVDALVARCPVDVCYVMTSDAEIDDHVVPVRDALELVVSRNLVGAILSVVPGELAIYEQPELLALRTWFARG